MNEREYNQHLEEIKKSLLPITKKIAAHYKEIDEILEALALRFGVDAWELNEFMFGRDTILMQEPEGLADDLADFYDNAKWNDLLDVEE